MVDGPIKRLARTTVRAAWWMLTPWRYKAHAAYLGSWLRARRRAQELADLRRFEASLRRRRALESSTKADLLPLLDTVELERLAGLPVSGLAVKPPIAAAINDVRLAAAFVLAMWRAQSQIRERFPRLFRGDHDAFLAWLRDGGAAEGGLPERAREHVARLFASDYAARARQAFLADPELREVLPHGLTPPGLPALIRWFVRTSLRDGVLVPEEVAWLVVQAAQAPAEELLAAHSFTPAWQRLHPDGCTVFGREDFARWFSQEYSVHDKWIEPAHWPQWMDADAQVRTAYVARDRWRIAHPAALRSEEGARALMDWLASPRSPVDERARRWCRSQHGDGLIASLAGVGMNVIGHFTAPSGLRVSAESLVDGARAAGVAMSLRDVRTGAGDDPHHADFHGTECHDVTIIHTQPHPYFDSVYERADLAPRVPRTYRIAYWYWEFDIVPESWLKQAEMVDEVWTATEFVAKGLRARLSKPVRTLFPGVRLAPYTRRPRAYFGLEKEPFTFLFTFSMTSVMERKNPLGLIRAFRLAFQPHEAVRLVLKTSFGEYHPKQLQLLHAAAAQGAGVRVINAVYSPDEVLSLMECCDAYVSLHRSEGLGLTMAEAMLMAKPVIATNYSGNVDFMNEGNCLLVPFELKKVGRPIPPYDADAVWAEPSIEEAAKAMRRLFDNQVWARELGARARISALDRLSLDAAGQRVAQRLQEIKALRQA